MRSKRIVSLCCAAMMTMGGMQSALSVQAAGFHVRGDVNADGVVGIADAVVLQKWLLGIPNTTLQNWDAANLCKDAELDVSDFTCMKRMILNPQPSVEITSPSCKAAALACIEDEEILYADHIDTRIAPASLTKLLTASVALQHLSPDTVITVGTEQQLVKPHSSLCLIKAGHKLKLCDLLMGMLIASGNDAAYTVAVAAARADQPDVTLSDSQAVTHFSEMMNQYAIEIGMKNSHFVNPEGWDDSDQYTTVSDLLILAKHAYSIPEIKAITGIYQKKVYFVSGENVTWTNTNSLLNPNSEYYCADAVGIKTGSTSNAGKCLIAAVRHDEKTYLSVVIGCATDSDRYALTLKILSAFGIR